jgi:hypothetical protein
MFAAREINYGDMHVAPVLYHCDFVSGDLPSFFPNSLAFDLSPRVFPLLPQGRRGENGLRVPRKFSNLVSFAVPSISAVLLVITDAGTVSIRIRRRGEITEGDLWPGFKWLSFFVFQERHLQHKSARPNGDRRSGEYDCFCSSTSNDLNCRIDGRI